MNNKYPEVVRQSLLAKRDLLMSERSKLDNDIADIDAFLDHDGLEKPGATIDAVLAPAMHAGESINRKIIDFAAANILPGVSLTTEKIYHLMVVNGAKFPQEGKSPQSRITRVISGTGLYKGHKTLGWSLKRKEPVAAGS